MGQYFTLVNVDKEQYVHAHEIGNGLKHGEQTGWKYSTEVVAGLLLGEPSDKHPLIGSWRGDARVGFIGDYGGSFPATEDTPLHPEVADNAEALYDKEDDDGWTNISPQVREMMTAVFGITYKGEGWLEIVEPDGTEAKPHLRPDMIIGIPQ